MTSYTRADDANNNELEPPAYLTNRLSEDDTSASPGQSPATTERHGEAVAPPPDHTALNASSLNFVIDGSFVSAAITSGEARYQLTTNIDQGLREMHIRRLRPEESRRLLTGETAMRFDKEDTLYTIIRKPLGKGMALYGQRKDALSGEIHVEHSLGRWKFSRVFGEKKKEVHEVLFRIWDIGYTDHKALMWKDADGEVVAVESREKEGDATSRPLLKLSEDMDGVRKDALVACWVARVWSFAGQPKSWKEKGEQIRHRVHLGEGFAPQPYTGLPKG